MWWTLQILANILVAIQLAISRVYGLNIYTWGFAVTNTAIFTSWMFIVSYEKAPSLIQAWFLGIGILSLCGFLLHVFYFKDPVSILNYMGVGLVLTGSVLLIK